MLFLQFLNYLKDFSVIENVGFDDAIDKINYQGTVILLYLCSFMVTAKQYFYSPISCYETGTMGGKNDHGYIQNMCWTEGLYPLNMSQTWSKRDKEWDNFDNKHLSYYQWVPLVLGVQAILFMIPWIFWQLINVQLSGFNFAELLGRARSIHLLLSDSRAQQTSEIAAQLLTSINMKNRLKNKLLFVGYIFIKTLFAIINWSQLYLIYYFLNLHKLDNYWNFGFRILSDLISGRMWQETDIFPRNGMCRHKFENLGSVNFVMAQCSLPINMINEKLYVFLYFYFWTLLILSIISIGVEITAYFQINKYVKQITKKLRSCILNNNENNNKEIIECQQHHLQNFVLDFLGNDGCFLLQMLSSKAGSLVTDEIVYSAFNQYSTNPQAFH